MRALTLSRRFAVLAAAGLLVAACSGGGDITDSGDKPSGSTVPGQTLAPTTTVAPDLLPDCPTDALATATDTVELTFWTGMTGPLAEALQGITDEYNASQSKVKVSLVSDSYEGTADKYLRASQDSRPDLVQMPEYMVQAMVDTESTVPVGKCIESSGYDM